MVQNGILKELTEKASFRLRQVSTLPLNVIRSRLTKGNLAGISYCVSGRSVYIRRSSSRGGAAGSSSGS